MRSKSPNPFRQAPRPRRNSYTNPHGTYTPQGRAPTPFPGRHSRIPGRITPIPDHQSSYLGRSSPIPETSPEHPATSPSPRPLTRPVTSDPEPDDLSEESALLGGSGIAVYHRRWYLLLLFSLLAMLQTLCWATWGPISQSAEAVFGWDDSAITRSVLMGNLPFACLCIPLAWLMDHKGLRIAVVLSTFFLTMGSGLRCVIQFVPSSYAIWCMYGGQLLNGMAGPVAQGAGALFSSLWFPPSQRASATAISTFVGYLGNAMAFILGPQLVPTPQEQSPDNGTLPDGNWTVYRAQANDSAVPNNTDTNSASVEAAILRYLDYQAGGAAAVFVLVLLYFPDKPPLPPSHSAAVEREDFRPGLVKLLRNGQFWLIASAFCLSLGVFEVWDVVLDVNLSYINISQDTAGWIGFYCIMCGCLTGLLICKLADVFSRYLRLFLLLSYVVSAIFLVWFILIYIGVLPFDMASIYAAIILSGVFLDGCSPLVYELICEAAYPVGEGVSSCFLQMLFTLVGMAFSSIQEIPNIGTQWMNWCLLGGICSSIPLLLFLNDTYNRTDLDLQVTVKPPPDPCDPSDPKQGADVNPVAALNDDVENFYADVEVNESVNRDSLTESGSEGKDRFGSSFHQESNKEQMDSFLEKCLLLNLDESEVSDCDKEIDNLLSASLRRQRNLDVNSSDLTKLLSEQVGQMHDSGCVDCDASETSTIPWKVDFTVHFRVDLKPVEDRVDPLKHNSNYGWH